MTAPSWSSQRGGMTLWQKTSSGWHTVRSGIPVWVGRNGFHRTSERHEGDGTTPAGKYPMRFVFSSHGNPGTTLPFRSLAPRTCWSGQRKDYNQWVRRTCGSTDEDLWSSRNGAYTRAAVIGFNDSPVVYGRGSAIFLHQTLSKPTSGCVSMSSANLLFTLRWMTAGSWIVMGPQAYVNSL